MSSSWMTVLAFMICLMTSSFFSTSSSSSSLSSSPLISFAEAKPSMRVPFTPDTRWWQDDPVDQEYQEYIEKYYDENDTEALEKAKSFVCGLCQIMVITADGLIKRRESEEKIHELLEKACNVMSDTQVLQKSGSTMHPEDSRRLCLRFVRETWSELLDALSVGDDPQHVCQNLDICDQSLKETMDAVSEIQKSKTEFMEEEKKNSKSSKKEFMEEEKIKSKPSKKESQEESTVMVPEKKETTKINEEIEIKKKERTKQKRNKTKKNKTTRRNKEKKKKMKKKKKKKKKKRKKRQYKKDEL